MDTWEGGCGGTRSLGKQTRRGPGRSVMGSGVPGDHPELQEQGPWKLRRVTGCPETEAVTIFMEQPGWGEVMGFDP